MQNTIKLFLAFPLFLLLLTCLAGCEAPEGVDASLGQLEVEIDGRASQGPAVATFMPDSLTQGVPTMTLAMTADNSVLTLNLMAVGTDFEAGTFTVVDEAFMVEPDTGLFALATYTTEMGATTYRSQSGMVELSQYSGTGSTLSGRFDMTLAAADSTGTPVEAEGSFNRVLLNQ